MSDFPFFVRNASGGFFALGIDTSQATAEQRAAAYLPDAGVGAVAVVQDGHGGPEVARFVAVNRAGLVIAKRQTPEA